MVAEHTVEAEACRRRSRPLGRATDARSRMADMRTRPLATKERVIFDALGGRRGAPPAQLRRGDAAGYDVVPAGELGASLADYGWKDANTKQPRDGVLSLEAKLRREAAEYLDALGMTPKFRARLGVDLVRTRPRAGVVESDPTSPVCFGRRPLGCFVLGLLEPLVENPRAEPNHSPPLGLRSGERTNR